MGKQTEADLIVSEDELDALETLQTRIADSLSGFETMVDRAEPEFRPVAVAFRDLHQRHEAEIARLLDEGGRRTGEPGSIMGTINRAVVATRALVDEIDADVMAQVRSGEEHVLEAFDMAIGHAADTGRARRLREMRQELERLLASPSKA